MDVPSSKYTPGRFDSVVQRTFMWMACASLLFFILLASVISDGANDTSMAWLHPIMGPFGFLRGDCWAHPARAKTVAAILVLFVFYCGFYRHVRIRSLLFFLMIFCWGAIGFISFLLYEGTNNRKMEPFHLNVGSENLLRFEGECHK